MTADTKKKSFVKPEKNHFKRSLISLLFRYAKNNATKMYTAHRKKLKNIIFLFNAFNIVRDIHREQTNSKQ